VQGLEVSYGPIKAVKGVSIELAAGKITTLVGANGAGKTSTLLALSGLVKKAAGTVRLEGRDLANLAPHRIVESGLVQVAEGRATLTTLTVRENLLLGAYTRSDHGSVMKDLDTVYELFPRLRDRAGGFAGNLSGGEQQMLAIGRAMMAKPKVLLLDEPSMGLAPIVVQGIFRTLRHINSQGVTMLLVEQNVRQALRIADYGYVLETGSVVLEGPGQTLLQDRQVQKAYLGG
jgi:branched-chain amino acid transport system ATP-binding protein